MLTGYPNLSPATKSESSMWEKQIRLTAERPTWQLRNKRPGLKSELLINNKLEVTRSRKMVNVMNDDDDGEQTLSSAAADYGSSPQAGISRLLIAPRSSVHRPTNSAFSTIPSTFRNHGGRLTLSEYLSNGVDCNSLSCELWTAHIAIPRCRTAEGSIIPVIPYILLLGGLSIS